ncbi:MAG: sulfite exporter TauE/SafE family protein [Flavihumibacter sp.]
MVQQSLVPSPVKFIHRASSFLLRRPARWYSALGFGAVNGLLPCGMVYLALVASVGAGTAAGATAFMAGFGLGTVPTMLLAALGLQWLRAHAGRLYATYFPLVILLTGLILVIRSASAIPDLLHKVAVHCRPAR